MDHRYLLEKLNNFILGTMLSENATNAFLLLDAVVWALREARFEDEEAREWAETIKRFGVVSDEDRNDPDAATRGAGAIRFARLEQDEKIELRLAVFELAGYVRRVLEAERS